MKPYYLIETDSGISFADVSRIDDHNYNISNLLVPDADRAKGYGTRIMNLIIQDADNEHATLHLIAREYGSTEESARLNAFYSRFGFTGSFDSKMQRKPLSYR
jgi:GNAT superfamily N-acetyltransferase